MMIDKIKNIIKNRGKKNIRFENIANEWLEYKKNSVKKSTYCNYMYVIEKYLKPRYKGRKIRKINNYNDFVDELVKKLSAKTVKDIINVLKAILKYYEEEYNYKLNIKKISIPKVEKGKVKILSKKDKKRLQEYCRNKGDLKCLGIILALNTGMRIGELCALKWENIDLDSRKIYVKNTIQRIYDENHNKSTVIIDKPKTQSSIREIPITQKLYDILRPLRKKYTDKSFFLTGKEDKFFEPRTYQYNFKLILQRAKIKKFNFHVLRHTFASNCIEVGMDAKSLSEILGHADVSITLSRYVHSSDQIKKKYLEKLE